jgi:hypothetical protein
LLRDFRERESSGDGVGDDDDGADADDADAADDPGTGDDGPGSFSARDAADAADDAAGTFGARNAAATHRERDRSPSAADSIQLRIERRRRTGVVLLLACFLTFGTAHMFTRAWGRGIALAGLEILGFMCIGARGDMGGALVAAAILGDLIGALWRVRTAPRSTLPEARVRGS